MKTDGHVLKQERKKALVRLPARTMDVQMSEFPNAPVCRAGGQYIGKVASPIFQAIRQSGFMHDNMQYCISDAGDANLC
jgi:hypothetical protein